MAQVVSHRPLSAESRVQYQASPCEICVGQSGTETGFFFRVLPFSSVSVIPPMIILIFIFMLLLRERQMDEAWEPLEINAVSEVGEHWIEKCFHLMYTYMQSVL